MATLKSKVNTIMAELEIDQGQRSIVEVVREACELLAIDSVGLTPGQMADRCMRAICSTDDASDVQSTAVDDVGEGGEGQQERPVLDLASAATCSESAATALPVAASFSVDASVPTVEGCDATHHTMGICQHGH